MTRQLIFAGLLILGTEARQFGVVNWAMEASEPAAWSADFVKTLGKTPNATLAVARRCLLATERSDGGGLSLELDGSRQLFSSPETRQRIEAFLTSRKTK